VDSAHTLSLGQLRVSRSHRFHADVGRDTLYAALRASSAFGALAADWAINPSFHFGGGAVAKSTPQTGLRHISNRSQVCRNGNWKRSSHAREAASLDPRVRIHFRVWENRRHSWKLRSQLSLNTRFN